jgi:hypothetical protein
VAASTVRELRIGTLSAARITPDALIESRPGCCRKRCWPLSRRGTGTTPDVDRAMTAYLRYPGGATAWLDVSFTQGGEFRAFAAAVQRGEPFPTTAEHALVTMGLIDDVHRAAGLSPRGEPQPG